MKIGIINLNNCSKENLCNFCIFPTVMQKKVHFEKFVGFYKKNILVRGMIVQVNFYCC